MINHLNITIYGEVQGVFMRRTVAHEAKRKGISGFIRNEPYGAVYLEVEAEEKILDEFISWLRKGAGEGMHKVQRVEVDKGEFRAFNSFEIQ